MCVRPGRRSDGGEANLEPGLMFVDSNIFCYYLNASSPHHQVVASELEDMIERRRLHTSVVVLMEVSHFLVNHLGPVKGRERMDDLLRVSLNVHDFDYALLTEGLDQLARHAPQGIGGRNAAILATMEQEGINTILTHDQAFQAVEDIRVNDPVNR